MADGTTRVDLNDSRGVSSSEENSPTSSPQKLISDCSDLYDLINLHPSATTQLQEETLKQRSEEKSASPEVIKRDVTKRRRDSSSCSSSSSSNHSDGPDSDSGSYARTNGHHNGLASLSSEGAIEEPIPPDSPESAVESSLEERATVGSSSLEGLSSAQNSKHEEFYEEEEEILKEEHIQQVFVKNVTEESIHKVEVEQEIKKEREEEADSDEIIETHVDTPLVIVEDTDVVALISSPLHDDDDDDDDNVDHSISDDHRFVQENDVDFDERLQISLDPHVEHPSDVVVTNTLPTPDEIEEQQKLIIEEVLADTPPYSDVQNAIIDEPKETVEGEEERHIKRNVVVERNVQVVVTNGDVAVDGGVATITETNRVVQTQVVCVTKLMHEEHEENNDRSSESSSDDDHSDTEQQNGIDKNGRMTKKVIKESSTTVMTTMVTSKKIGDGVTNVEKKTTSSSNSSEMELVENGGGGVGNLTSNCDSSETSSSNVERVRTLSISSNDDDDNDGNNEVNNTPSVAILKSTFANQVPINNDSDNKLEKETVLTGISIAQLRASFNEHNVQNSDKLGTKEVIDTGVNIKSLRTCSHSDLRKLDVSFYNHDEFDSPASLPSVIMRAKSYSDLSRYEEERKNDREAIYTGVSVKALCASFCNLAKASDQGTGDSRNHRELYVGSSRTSFSDSDAVPLSHKESIETGVSIAQLKSSFNSSESVRQNSDFDETEGVKIDRAKVTRNFSQVECPLYSMLDANESISNLADEKSLMCRICGKEVFHMERIKAEKSVFHKQCFRCHECSKPLSVDTYCSHEGVLYCRLHFRQLFQPKAKFEEETIIFPRRRHEMIIKENIPAELPPDVIRSADKPDYGLNEIPSLKNIKSRFENGEQDIDNENGTNETVTVQVKRSESIASRLAKFKNLESPENGHTNGNDSSESSSDEDEDRDPQVVRETKKKEKTSEISIEATEEDVVFTGMTNLKTQWEAGSSTPTKEERARERQEELAKLRLRICHGKGSLKAKYESACEESVKSPNRCPSLDVNGEIHTTSLKEKFEKGEVMNEDELEKVDKILKEKEDDLSVFKEQGTAADARNLFKEIDRSASSAHLSQSTSPTSNVKRSPSMRTREVIFYAQTPNGDGEIVRASDKIDDDIKGPIDLSAKFKFFENFQDKQNGGEKKRFTITPPREVTKEESPEPASHHDPNIVRACDQEEEIIHTDTAKKMLNKFREMESKAEKDDVPVGPKPLKRITPPREYTKDNESPDLELPRDPNIIRSCDKVEDEFLIEARKAKTLKEKFEHWDEMDSSNNDVEQENCKNQEDELLQPCPDTTKNLKAKFEAMQEENVKSMERPKPKVNRFIDLGGGGPNGENCSICNKRVYPMEKLELTGHKLHKTCFRCSYCSSVLRMDNYTKNGDALYCTPHFKQLFIQCGNYDVGFGREQHKERWNRSRPSTPTPINSQEFLYVNGDSNE